LLTPGSRERREHLVRRAALVQHLTRINRVRRARSYQIDTVRAQCLFDSPVPPGTVGAEVGRDVDRACVCGPRDGDYLLDRIPAPELQAPDSFAQPVE